MLNEFYDRVNPSIAQSPTIAQRQSPSARNARRIALIQMVGSLFGEFDGIGRFLLD
jgi:hypothetical protein